jgi:hypothetical protein
VGAVQSAEQSAHSTRLRDDIVVKPLNWLLRGLLGLGGVVLAYQAWPVSQSAWQAQKADTVVGQLRTLNLLGTGPSAQLASILAGIAALDRAVEADPVASRYLQRSELLIGVALTPELAVTLDQRVAWLRSAEADLIVGLGAAPARGIAWARLAAVRQGLQGTSRGVVDALLMSIDTAPMVRAIWPARLQLILDNWVAFTPQERERLAAYVAMTWRRNPERRWFADNIRTSVDELFVRYFLRDEPKAQEELGVLLEYKRRAK